MPTTTRASPVVRLRSSNRTRLKTSWNSLFKRLRLQTFNPRPRPPRRRSILRRRGFRHLPEHRSFPPPTSRRQHQRSSHPLSPHHLLSQPRRPPSLLRFKLHPLQDSIFPAFRELPALRPLPSFHRHPHPVRPVFHRLEAPVCLRFPPPDKCRRSVRLQLRILAPRRLPALRRRRSTVVPRLPNHPLL